MYRLTSLAIFGLFVLITSSNAIAIESVAAVQEKDSKYFDYEDYKLGPDGKPVPIGGLEFLKGCSWYCGGYVSRISATSELTPSGELSYEAQKAHDFEKDTAWVEGRKGYGIGESLIYEFNFGDKDRFGVTKILLANGYKKSKELWIANSRVKRMRLYVNDEPYLDLDLLDSFEIQTIDIGKIMFPADVTTTLRFEILDVYPGEKYQDTAISELVFEGVGVH